MNLPIVAIILIIILLVIDNKMEHNTTITQTPETTTATVPATESIKNIQKTKSANIERKYIEKKDFEKEEIRIRKELPSDIKIKTEKCNINNNELKNAFSNFMDIGNLFDNAKGVYRYPDGGQEYVYEDYNETIKRLNIDLFTDESKKKINNIVNFLTDIPYDNMKCMGGEYNIYDNMCKTINRSDSEISNTLNLIEKILETYGKNAGVILDNLLDKIGKFEKDCMKMSEPKYNEQIKRILVKIGKILYDCNDVKKELKEKYDLEIIKSVENEKNICKNEINDNISKQSFWEKNWLYGWIGTGGLSILVFIMFIIMIIK
jgi:hypothetical protein